MLRVPNDHSGAGGDELFDPGEDPKECRHLWHIPAGRVSHHTAMTMDLFSTLLSITGIAPPPDHAFDGIDLSPHLLEDVPLTERPLFWRMGPGKAAAPKEGTYHRKWQPENMIRQYKPPQGALQAIFR